MQDLSHFIDGKRVPRSSGRFADVYNPATGEVQAKVPLASKAEVESAIADALSVSGENRMFKGPTPRDVGRPPEPRRPAIDGMRIRALSWAAQARIGPGDDRYALPSR